MLGKLMKYELKAMGRIQLPIYGALLIITVLNALMMRFNLPADGFFFMIPVIMVMLYFFCIFVTLIMNTILSILRFHRNILGKEGYLMHTLPVSTAQNILGKLFTVVLFQIISIAAAVLSFFLLLVITANMDMAVFGQAFRAIFENLDKIQGEWVLFFLELVGLGLISAAFGTLMIYAAMAVGHMFNRHKIIKSIGIYILLDIAVNIAVSVLIAALFNSGTVFMGVLDSIGPVIQSNIVLAVFMVFLLIWSMVFFLITNYFLKHKLNLE